MQLWLTLFNAATEEDLARIEALEVPVMKEAIGAYRQVSATGEFREIERLRSRARHNEASALYHARSVGVAEGMAKGKAEGMTEGLSAGQIKSILTFLEIRFGEVPPALRKKVRHVKDEGHLEALVKSAATCQSLKEFQKAL